MIVGYLVNQYPQPSHSFIRREIAALEAAGVPVRRYTLRASQGVVDEADKAEQARTRVVLSVGAIGLVGALLVALLVRPTKFARSLVAALRIGWRSDRGPVVHLIYLAEACVLLRWFAADKVDHVHAHFGTNSTTVALLCRLLGGPRYSFTCHGPEEFDRPEALGLGEKVRHCAFVVAISQFGRSQIYRWSRFEDWTKVHLVHCGLDEAFLASEKTPVPDVRRLVCVGRLAEQKGQLLLVQAAAKLARAGESFELILVGDGPFRQPLERLIAQHELHDRVRITGWMSNAQVREQLLQARAMVLPSFAEGLPVVIMEALALGRPVISTYVAGIPELVQNDESGWLVPASSVEALVEAMRRALHASPTELSRMGHVGASIVAKQHNASVEAAKLAVLFRNADAASG